MATETNNGSRYVGDHFAGTMIFFRRKIETIRTFAIGTLIVRIMKLYWAIITIKENNADNNNDDNNII